ncbi:MAG TPA: CBS domain-containing protein [Vicinamibacteria bacterium]|nr:CBS domain-containing protein [Vicinamibacteria bacterium]
MRNRCPRCGTELPEGVPEWVRQLTVRDVMTANPVTIGPEDTLSRALEVMRMHGIRRIPVMVADTLVGLLAEGDVKRAQPSTLSASEEEFQRVMDGTQVARIMIKDPITVTDRMPLVEAVQTLHTTKFGALPVLRDGRLCGIVTDFDLLGCLEALLAHGG